MMTRNANTALLLMLPLFAMAHEPASIFVSSRATAAQRPPKRRRA